MLKSICSVILLIATLVQPTFATAEGRHGHKDTHEPDWRSLFHDSTRNQRGDDRWRQGQGAPRTAPPVIIAPPHSRAQSRAATRDLPASCLRRVDTRYGLQTIYATGCLQGFPALAARLPNGCRVRLVTWGSTRDGYDAACLRAAGYRGGR